MTPTISIAVPIGAYHPLLRDCLASLASQSPRPTISVMDASGDARTADVVDEFGPFISYRRAGRDGGQTAAILEGWENAPGEILGWLNADDALYPEALDSVAAHFSENPDTDVFYGNSVIINDDDEIVGYHWAVEPPSAAILYGCIISQPSCFFRRSAYEAAGGLDASLHYTMDWDLWTRLWKSGARFRSTDDVFSRVLWSRDAKTGGFGSKRRKELNRIIDANNPPLRRVKSRIGFGLHHLLEYAAPSGVAVTVRAFRGAKTIHGLGRNGEIVGEASIPIAYYGPRPSHSLQVILKVEGPAVLVSVAGREHEAAGAAAIDIPLCVRSGEAPIVRFRAAPKGSARLRSIRIA
jgi:glycosyltransferase involved in cell wall biosynthesis